MPSAMHETDLFTLFTRPFDIVGLDYFVTGSVASMIYGEPRLTLDVDIILTLPSGDLKKLAAAFPEDSFYIPPLEVLRIEAARPQRGHFILIHHETGYKADIYLTGGDPLHAWAFERRRLIDFDGTPIWFAPPEYVIIRKLQFYREGRSDKHLRDIRAMLEHTQPDQTELDRFIAEHSLQSEWQAVFQPH
jgi:hypothetical protein